MSTVLSFPTGGFAVSDRPAIFPPGLVGDVADFIYRAAPYPDEMIALTGAIGFVAGIAGRAFNVEDAGLNQYVLVLAPTGRGKEAIASGIAKIMAAARPAAMHISNFKGPGQLVSGPGLFKFLARLSNPVVFSIIGEFGLMLKMMDAPNAAPNMAGLKKVLLELYSKSEHGAEFDPAAYSDRDNVTAVIPSPSYTIIGEGVPGTFYETLNEGMVASGLLPRFIVFETNTPRPRLNRQRVTEPSPEMIDRVGRLATLCMTLGTGNQVHYVAKSAEAEELFYNFEGFTHDRWNAHNVSEISRELWTRAYMKALKLAALVAVGSDLDNPVIGYDVAVWATNLIVDQTNALIGKFDRGEIGDASGNVLQQQDKVRAVMRECIERPFDEIAKQYGGDNFEKQRDQLAMLHSAGFVTHQYIQRRVLNLRMFQDGQKPNETLKKVMATLADNAEIRFSHPHGTKALCGLAYLAYGFAEYDPNNLFENSKKQTYWNDSPADIARRNMK